MPRCIRCAIDGDDVTMHNGAWVHRAPGICFKKLRDVVESLQRERTDLRARLAEAERVTEEQVSNAIHAYDDAYPKSRVEKMRTALTAARGGSV